MEEYIHLCSHPMSDVSAIAKRELQKIWIAAPNKLEYVIDNFEKLEYDGCIFELILQLPSQITCPYGMALKRLGMEISEEMQLIWLGNLRSLEWISAECMKTMVCESLSDESDAIRNKAMKCWLGEKRLLVGEFCIVRIQELSLFNYRRFENKKFTLNPGMNVFVGKNGSGKTSVLEAVNVMLGAYLAAYKTYVPSRFVYNIKSTDARQKAQISEDSTILTTGTISQYPCKISCKAQWDKKNEPIEFQRVILKEDARTKFGGSNPMQPTVIEGEKTCTGIRDAIKAGICSDANKK